MNEIGQWTNDIQYRPGKELVVPDLLSRPFGTNDGTAEQGLKSSERSVNPGHSQGVINPGHSRGVINPGHSRGVLIQARARKRTRIPAGVWLIQARAR